MTSERKLFIGLMVYLYNFILHNIKSIFNTVKQRNRINKMLSFIVSKLQNSEDKGFSYATEMVIFQIF
jgi:hypothetical protein